MRKPEGASGTVKSSLTHTVAISDSFPALSTALMPKVIVLLIRGKEGRSRGRENFSYIPHQSVVGVVGDPAVLGPVESVVDDIGTGGALPSDSFLY